VFDPDTGYQDLLAAAAQPRVLFGVHAYDIYGLNILDRVFIQGKFADPYYATRRRTPRSSASTSSRTPCTSPSMHADWVDTGFDLFLSDIGEAYLVLVGTSRGHDMVVMSGCLLEEPTRADFAEFKRRSARRREAYTTRVELTGFCRDPRDGVRQRRLGRAGRALPLVRRVQPGLPHLLLLRRHDEVELGSRAGRRLRVWDSCLFKTHALVAGGENFRHSRASRVKFRFYHKQRGFVAEYGRPSCVGCGRCIVACPAGIDIVTSSTPSGGRPMRTQTARRPQLARWRTRTSRTWRGFPGSSGWCLTTTCFSSGSSTRRWSSAGATGRDSSSS
jgi:sulfhydrogenase subunit beta (sulfur reductase)